MEENYIYPVYVSEDDDVFTITFPDFGNMSTFADSKDEIIPTAQEFLAMTIIDYEQKNQTLPEPSQDLKGAVYLHIWLPYFRNQIQETYSRKTVTIPAWLELLGRKNNINFSAAMVRGLKEELHLKK